MLPLPAIEPNQGTPAVVRALLAWGRALSGAVLERFEVARHSSGTVVAKPGQLLVVYPEPSVLVVLPRASGATGQHIVICRRGSVSYSLLQQPGDHLNDNVTSIDGVAISARVTHLVSDGSGWWYL